MTEQHQHIWTHHKGTWTCVDCPETTPTCIVNKPDDDENGHPTGIPAQNICPSCVRYEQHVLDGIADALGHWQHQPRSLVPAIRYDRDKLKGSRTQDDRPAITQPSDVIDVLWSWADMWSATRGEQPPAGDVLTFLKRHILWAVANHDQAAWDDYRTEMRQMRHHARRLAGLLPKRLAGPCVHCGGQVVQDWADEKWQPRIDVRPEHNGLSDVVRCTGCDLTWRHHEAWMYTNRHTIQLLPDVEPSAHVTLDDARAIWPDVPDYIWWKWKERNETAARDLRTWQKQLDKGHHGPAPEPPAIPTAGTDPRGRFLYRLADLTTRVEEWQQRSTARTTRRRQKLAG